MTAAYVLTKDVKHLASWTQDSPKPDGRSWTTGTYRPICGGKIRPWKDVFHGDVEYEDQRRVRRAERLPVCKKCAKTLAALDALTGALS